MLPLPPFFWTQITAVAARLKLGRIQLGAADSGTISRKSSSRTGYMWHTSKRLNCTREMGLPGCTPSVRQSSGQWHPVPVPSPAPVPPSDRHAFICVPPSELTSTIRNRPSRGGWAVRTVSRPALSFCTRNEQELTTGRNPSPWSSSLISTLVPVPVPNPRRLAPLQYHGLHLHAHGGLVVVEMDLSLSAHLSSIARRRTNIAPDVNPFCWLVCA